MKKKLIIVITLLLFSATITPTKKQNFLKRLVVPTVILVSGYLGFEGGKTYQLYILDSLFRRNTDILLKDAKIINGLENNNKRLTKRVGHYSEKIKELKKKKDAAEKQAATDRALRLQHKQHCNWPYDDEIKNS